MRIYSCFVEAGPDRPLRDSSAWRESYGSSDGAARPSARQRQHSDTEAGDEEEPSTNRGNQQQQQDSAENDEQEDSKSNGVTLLSASINV